MCGLVASPTYFILCNYAYINKKELSHFPIWLSFLIAHRGYLYGVLLKLSMCGCFDLLDHGFKVYLLMALIAHFRLLM